MVEAHGVQPKAPLFFSATVEDVVQSGPTEVTGEMKIKLTVLQGHPEVLTLGLSGSGEVVEWRGMGCAIGRCGREWGCGGGFWICGRCSTRRRRTRRSWM